jgi:hypothetical protein
MRRVVPTGWVQGATNRAGEADCGCFVCITRGRGWGQDGLALGGQRPSRSEDVRREPFDQRRRLVFGGSCGQLDALSDYPVGVEKRRSACGGAGGQRPAREQQRHDCVSARTLHSVVSERALGDFNCDAGPGPLASGSKGVLCSPPRPLL